MKIIYLDQFIVSDLADSPNKEWQDLRILLEKLVNSGEICCPLSMEHYLESSSRENNEALTNDRLMNILSNGKCFYPEFYITTFLINAFIKNKPFTVDMFIDQAVKNIFDNKVKIEKFRTANQEYRDIIIDNQSIANDIRTITRRKRIKSPLTSSIFQLTKKLPSTYFVERVEELLIKGDLVIRGEKTPHGEIPNWIDLILEYLLRHFKITIIELIKLYKEVKENGFENIPTLDIISNLRAYQAILHKKVTANDEVDNLRIACGLPIADILFTDKKRKFEVLDIGLDLKYQCKVLSGSNDDIIEFKRYLNKIKIDH